MLDSKQADQVSDLLSSVQTDSVAPGGAFAVIQDNELLLSDTFGYANLEHKIRVTEDTVFDIASVSKQFTALAILQLIDDGKLQLDDDVSQYLDWFPRFSKPIKIHHLIHHTSGLRCISRNIVLTGRTYCDTISSKNAKELLKRQQDLNHLPGARHSYTNMGYFVLAQIVEVISGKTFPEFLTAYIFEPLGMSCAHIPIDNLEVIPNCAESYSQDEQEFFRLPSNEIIAGPGSLHINLKDFIIWAKQFGNPQSIFHSMLKQMYELRPLDDGKYHEYAFGLERGKYRDLATIEHDGRWLGYLSRFLHIPEKRLTLVMMTNSNLIKVRKFSNSLIDIILAIDSRDDQTTQPIDIPNSELKKFCGLYQTELGDFREIDLNAKQLQLRFLPDSGMARLHPVSPLHFVFGDEQEITLEFTPNTSSNELTAHYVERIPNGIESFWKKVERVNPSLNVLKSYEGTYYSPELETIYRIEIDDATLQAKSISSGDITLIPQSRDAFTGVWWFPTINFLRQADQTIYGFQVSLERVRNVLFNKID